MTGGRDRYDLYGLLAGNPYVNRPLDALSSASDRSLLLELGGFVELAVIQAAAERAAAREASAFFLITGKGNSGRTSLANHVMHLYRQACTRKPGYVLVTHCADQDEMTHDAYGLVRSTLLSLRNQMPAHGIQIPDDLRPAFAELSRDRNTQMNEYDLQDIARHIATAFSTRNAGFGIRYEGVPAKDLIMLATTVFETSAAVVVFTVDSYRHANAAQLTPADRQRFSRRGHLVVDLSTLTPDQIAALADARWNGASPTPFDPQGVRTTFGAQPYTIGQVLHYLEMMLDFRLSEYDGEEPWPQAKDLRIDGPYMQTKMWQRERWLGAVNV
ncbi:hypothetical protein HII36_17345 [Nonomuraea sp. NN258]|uniref:hypothetical protein n=1 Tax=Nonomuraea antri TaxID=2730852 RepID=UPI0015698432|nr:hypothetical protein [Nonomuraea antri]NRQ33601.1 hypothetical protein [Nonomuraea antri]